MSSSRPLSIVHIAAPGRVGGLERVVQGLAGGLATRGHEVAVISILGPGEGGDHPFALPIEEAGAIVHELEFPSRAALRERAAVRRILEQFRPHVVHTHGYRPDVLHASTARGLSIATATTEHGSSKLGGKTVIYERIQRWSFRRFQAVVAVSSPIASRLESEGISSDRVHLIPNGWSGGVTFLDRDVARRRLGVPADKPLVGYVGRLIPAKGPDVFVDAVLRLADLPIYAVVIGEGSERGRLEDAISKAGAEDRVFLRGHVDDAAPLFKAFDLFVLSSRTEGTPITLFEAIAAGVPAVATSVGGVPDVVTERESVPVPPEDPAALASAIRWALANSEEVASRAGCAAERLEQEFGVDRWLRRHEDLYRAISNT